MKKGEVKRLFEDNVDKNPLTGCWIWRPAVFRFTVDGKRYVPTHLAYQLYIGEKPEGKRVHRTCRHPECVNPEHLYIQGDIQAALEQERIREHKIASCPTEKVIAALMQGIQKKYGLTVKAMTAVLYDIVDKGGLD